MQGRKARTTRGMASMIRSFYDARSSLAQVRIRVEKRLPSKSKSKLWEIDFGIFMEQFEDVWTSLVGLMKYSRAIASLS